MSRTRIYMASATAALVFTLTACGGGSGGSGASCVDGIELERLKTSFSQKQTLEGQAEGYLDYAEFYRDSYPELSSAYLEVSKMVTEYAGGNDALQPQIDALLFGPIRELRRQVVVCQ